MSYAINYVRADLGSTVQRRQLESAPMTKILRDDLGVRIKRIHDTVEAKVPEAAVADLLEIDSVSPGPLLHGHDVRRHRAGG
ncbi:UTRA domain-containing protein [Streptomyces sp. NBC_01356]|uniref:UTRA domain-containing protein n=1 Tax=Streptomyces sp. NBC_01356 TaxID=2903836 RepID=UPI003FCCE83A